MRRCSIIFSNALLSGTELELLRSVWKRQGSTAAGYETMRFIHANYSIISPCLEGLQRAVHGQRSSDHGLVELQGRVQGYLVTGFIISHHYARLVGVDGALPGLSPQSSIPRDALIGCNVLELLESVVQAVQGRYMSIRYYFEDRRTLKIDLAWFFWIWLCS